MVRQRDGSFTKSLNLSLFLIDRKQMSTSMTTKNGKNVPKRLPPSVAKKVQELEGRFETADDNVAMRELKRALAEYLVEKDQHNDSV